MKTILTLFILFFAVTAFSQAPAIQWEKCFGGSANEIPYSARQTPDHGFIIAGETWSNDKDVTYNHGYIDVWVIKLDSDGNLQWQKSYGGSGADGALCIRTTSDGGYIFSATSYSNDGDVTGHHGSTEYADAWIVKLDATGSIEWEKSYGGSLYELPFDIIQTYDGGYIFLASSNSNDGDVTNHHGDEFTDDYWVAKLDAVGNIEWENSFGGSGQEEVCSVLQLPDSGYFAVGNSKSDDGDVTGHHGSLKVPDVWIVKLNKTGKLIAEESLPNYQYQGATDACFSSKQGYVIAGACDSYPSRGVIEHGNDDLMLMKLSKRGAKLDTVCAMGGSQGDAAFSISTTKDEGYITAGQTFSGDGDVTGYHAGGDCWIVKVDSMLRLQWEEALGGTDGDVGLAVQQTFDGGYIIANESSSNNGDVSGNHGSGDFWIVKLAPDNQPATNILNEQAKLSENNGKDLSLYPNPARTKVNVSFSFSNNIITISDLYGRELKRTIVSNGNSTLVDVGSLQDGVYILSIRDEKGNLVASEKLFRQ